MKSFTTFSCEFQVAEKIKVLYSGAISQLNHLNFFSIKQYSSLKGDQYYFHFFFYLLSDRLQCQCREQVPDDAGRAPSLLQYNLFRYLQSEFVFHLSTVHTLDGKRALLVDTLQMFMHRTENIPYPWWFMSEFGSLKILRILISLTLAVTLFLIDHSMYRVDYFIALTIFKRSQWVPIS